MFDAIGKMFGFIPAFLGQILYFIYNNLAFKNYGFAIIIFTIFIKLLLMPLTIKQYKSSAKMQELQPLMQELKRKHKNDPTKFNEEMLKVYAEHKYNPASGCLPMLFQMPILFSLIYVIGKPLNYLLNYDSEKIKTLLQSVPESMRIGGFYEQISAVDYHNILNMEFFGLNLGLVPTWRPNILFGPQMAQYLPLIVIPILAIITTYLSTKLMTPKINNNNSSDTNVAMQKNMMMIAPIMTLIVSFQFPAGLGLYWFTGNVFQIFQQLFLNKYVIKKKEVKDK